MIRDRPSPGRLFVFRIYFALAPLKHNGLTAFSTLRCSMFQDVKLMNNKYRVLRSYDGDYLKQRVLGGTDRTYGMARINGINQMGPKKLKFQVEFL